MSTKPLPPWTARQLETLLGQRGHAWLLHGPSGLGQFELGLALVRAWLCDAPVLPAARGASSPGRPIGACGECASCHGIAVHTHADLLVLMPEAEMLARGWPLSEKAQREIDEKKRKPSREIRIDAMREAIEFAQRTSGRGRGKAVLVYPAERMNAVTANALLKTLEEPPGDVRFILASDAAHLLLPTIRSRCQSHTLAWPDAAEATAWLVEQGVDAAQAPALLRGAGGRPANALALAAGKDGARRWRELPRALAAGDAAPLADLPLPEIVARLQKLCHDLLALRVGAAPRYFDPADLPAQPPPLGALMRWWSRLARSARSAEHPINAQLATEFLVNTARSVLNSANRVA